MKSYLRAALSAAVSCLAVPAVASGCSADHPGPTAEETEATATAAVHAKLDADFRTELSSALAVAEMCKNERTEACAMRAIAIHGGVGGTPSGIQPRDWWNWESATDRIRQALAMTHDGICDSIRWTQDHARVYYVIGIAGTLAYAGYATAGAERVWDLTLHQGLAFKYAGGGIGNIGGISGSVYEGFAVAGVGGGLLDNWTGCFINSNVTLAVPETAIGGGLAGFRGCSANPVAVQGIVWHGDAGINFFNPVAVTVSGGATYYWPFDTATDESHWFTDDLHGNAGEHFLDFKAVSTPLGSLTAGYAQAVHILWYGGGAPGSFVAAATAIGLDKFRSTPSWCARRTAQLDCGNSSGGLSTAACSGGGDDFPPSNPGPTGTGNVPPQAPVSCAVDNHCDADDACSPNGHESFCCRPQFASSSPIPCDPGLDTCGSGKICAAGAQAADPSVTFTCIDPEAHPCSATNP